MHQDDEYEDAEGNSLKAKAIRSFAGLVRRSERLVILLDPTYFERLWCVSPRRRPRSRLGDEAEAPSSSSRCVFETAAFLHLDRSEDASPSPARAAKQRSAPVVLPLALFAMVSHTQLYVVGDEAEAPSSFR